MEALLQNIEQFVIENVMPNLKADKSHGIDHFREVTNHGIEGTKGFEDWKRESILVACYLHDVDDQKLQIKKSNKSYAGFVIDSLGIGNKDIILKMIDLVSCSKWGDNREGDLPD